MQDRRKKLTVRQMIDRLSIDDQTSEPYYKQLIRHIELLIESGEIVHGLGLPSERDLAQALNLSRTTVKRCYDELRSVGLLNAHGRGGTSVNNPEPFANSLAKITSFSEEIQALGKSASTKLESIDIWLDKTVASIFQLPADVSFLRVVRLHLADGVPINREVAWYEVSAVPALQNWDATGSVYQFLQEVCKVSLGWAEQSIEAMPSSDVESKLFGFKASSPCLFLKRRTYGVDSKLIEYVETTCRGDAYAYQVKLGF